MSARATGALCVASFVIGLLIGLMYQRGQIVQLEVGLNGLALAIQAREQ